MNRNGAAGVAAPVVDLDGAKRTTRTVGRFLLIQLAVLVLMAGVTAWQTQSLKLTYASIAGDQRSMAVMTNYGALNLYIAFINMFQVILMLLGNRD